MKKIMQGKMDKKTFWIAVVISWLLIIMLAVNLSTGDWLGDIGRGAVGIIALVIYFSACAMRLRDAGKSVGLMLIMCIVPIYAFVIGSYESEEPYETDVENEEKETMQNEAGEGYRVEQELIKKYETILPNELLEIWKNNGFTDLLDGYLRVINPEEYQDLLAETFFKGKSSIPILTTAFGDIIAVDEEQYIVIVRYKYGSFNILAKNFKRFAQNLEENYFLEKYFQIPQYMEAVNRLGKLEHDECFGYVPLLGLGGSEKVENLKKVKLKEHIEIISQLVGKIGME